MMKKVSNSIKRWWVVALVFVLALSLTSCSRRSRFLENGDFGKAVCNGDFGSFVVYTVPQDGNTNRFEVYLQIDQPAYEGEVVSSFANDDTGNSFKPLLAQFSLNSGNELLLGTVSMQELYQYTTLTITPYQNQTYFNDPNYFPEAEQFCELPLPPTSDQSQALNGR